MLTKTFDCVKMKREGAEHLRRLLAGMTPEERRVFWEQQYQQMLQKQAQLKLQASRAETQTG